MSGRTSLWEYDWVSSSSSSSATFNRGSHSSTTRVPSRCFMWKSMKLSFPRLEDFVRNSRFGHSLVSVYLGTIFLFFFSYLFSFHFATLYPVRPRPRYVLSHWINRFVYVYAHTYINFELKVVLEFFAFQFILQTNIYLWFNFNFSYRCNIIYLLYKSIFWLFD